MNRPRRPGARSVQLWGRGHQAGTGERLLAAQAPLLPPSPVGLAKQLAGALRPISKKARLLGAERREPGGWEVVCECVCVCVLGGWGGRPSQLLQPSEQVVSTCGRGGVGGR